MRYKLYEQGPDNHSTYQDCWGATATSPGRLLAEGARLDDLAHAVPDHENWSVRTGPGRYLTPTEYRRRRAR